MRWIVPALLLSISTVTLCGCGEVPDATRPGGWYPYGYAGADLAWATDTAIPGHWKHGHQRLPTGRFLLNMSLLRGGTLITKNTTYELGPGEFRAENLAALRDALDELGRGVSPDLGSQELFLLIDRRAPWGAVVQAVGAAQDSPLAIETVNLAVHSNVRPGGRALQFEVEATKEGLPASGIRLDSTSREGAVRIAVADGAWHDLPSIPERPSASWEPALPEALPPDTQAVVLEAGETVPWEAVVRVLDACRQAGVRQIAVPQARIVLGVREHARDAAWNPHPPPVLEPGGAIAIFALCLVAGWLAWRSRRPVQS